MRARLHKLLVAGLIGAAALLPAQAAPEVLAAEQVLRIGNGPEVETLDPHRAQGVSAANVLRDLYEGLIGEDRSGDLLPGAAARWDISEDLLSYTFHLRADARWSNGDPVVAEDFVAGLRRSVDPKTGSNYSQILAPVENAEAVIEGKLPPTALGVEAVDALTLRIRLKGPTPYLLGLLTHASTYPIHRPSLAQYGDQFAQPGQLIGNGAYRLVERVVQSHLTLERNRHYWDDAQTHLMRVLYINTEDASSEFKRFRTGELDWTSGVPSNQTQWIRQNLSESYRVSTYLGVYYYGLNLRQPPFKDNPKLRRALTMAIDRDVITGKVVGAGEQPAYSWVPPGVSGYRGAVPEWAGWTREQRLAEARKLYAEAGYSKDQPLNVEIRYNTSEDHKKIATVIAAMWKQWLGVRTQLINEEWKVYLQNRNLGARTQAYRAGWIGDYNDANTFLEILQSRHGLNDTGWSSPAYDALLQQAAVEPDRDKRENQMHQAEKILLEELPVIPLYFYVTDRLVAPYVVGWEGNIMDHHHSKHLRILAH